MWRDTTPPVPPCDVARQRKGLSPQTGFCTFLTGYGWSTSDDRTYIESSDPEGPNLWGHLKVK
jgi:hypothetical protein